MGVSKDALLYKKKHIFSPLVWTFAKPKKIFAKMTLPEIGNFDEFELARMIFSDAGNDCSEVGESADFVKNDADGFVINQKSAD